MIGSVWLLILVSVLNGRPIIAVQPFDSLTSCQSAQADLTTDLIKNKINYAAVSCTEHKIGFLS